MLRSKVSSFPLTTLRCCNDLLTLRTDKQFVASCTVVLTGDIATTGEPENLDKALEFFEAQPDPKLGTQTLEGRTHSRWTVDSAFPAAREFSIADRISLMTEYCASLSS